MGRNAGFPKIPFERFRRFHSIFNGEGTWWNTCFECGGKCELNKIGSLMPGEKEFIADSLGLPIEVFQDRYLDKLVTPLGVIDVLKMKQGCPFLDTEFRCSIASVKVVLCEVYPIVFHTLDDKVAFSIDPWCPLSQHADVKRYLEHTGIPALLELNVPIEWYRAVELYDSFNFDYERIEKLRKAVRKYESFELEVILNNRA